MTHFRETFDSKINYNKKYDYVPVGGYGNE